MALTSDSMLGRALRLGDSDCSQLAEGLVLKLDAALTELGTLACPVGGHPSQGVKWRMLAVKAQLAPIEWQSLLLWIEEVYGEAVVTRAQQDFTASSLSPAPAPEGASIHPILPPGAATHSSEAAAMTAAMGGMRIDHGADMTGTMTGAAAFATSNLDSDMRSMGLNEGEIAILTFTLYLGRLPQSGHAEVKYGVDPSTTKMYSKYTSGSLLMRLVDGKATTMAQFNSHFLDASNALRSGGMHKASHLVSAAWMEVQTHASDVELVKAYWKKFFQEYSGRGLPKVIDEQVLLAALAQKVCSSEGDRNDGAMESLRKEFENLRSVVQGMKDSVTNLKTEVTEIKKGVRKCDFCGEYGHTKKMCHKNPNSENYKKPAET